MIKNKYYQAIWLCKKIIKKILKKQNFIYNTKPKITVEEHLLDKNPTTQIMDISGNDYRHFLFQDLVKNYGITYFKNKKILEIGPRDGEDTLRLDTLNPSHISLIDLPIIQSEAHHSNYYWENYMKENLKKLKSPYEFYFNNFHYMSIKELEALGKFDLIWFTGILYHNPEQLRLLKKIYKLLNNEGIVVIETATSRNWKLTNQVAIEIVADGQYHFPTRKGLLQMLKMVGFSEILISNCYDYENYNKKNIRIALTAKKLGSESEGKYRGFYNYGEST